MCLFAAKVVYLFVDSGKPAPILVASKLAADKLFQSCEPNKTKLVHMTGRIPHAKNWLRGKVFLASYDSQDYDDWGAIAIIFYRNILGLDKLPLEFDKSRIRYKFSGRHNMSDKEIAEELIALREAMRRRRRRHQDAPH